MKKILIVIAAALLAMNLGSCSKDNLDSKSIFDDEATTEPETAFDKWLISNYTDSFNIKVIYRYVDKETSSDYNVVPTAIEQAKGMAFLLRHVWLDAYKEVKGSSFIKSYSPRIFKFIGSPMYKNTGEMTLGDAGGGAMISLTNVNALDIDNPYADVSTPLSPKSVNPLDMNYWFFKTMHHEFCHIMNQTKDYSTDFKTISAGNYAPSDWYNKKDEETLPEGFISAYASSAADEDFAECYAYYVTHTPEAYAQLLERAGTEGAAIIEQKMEMIKDYYNDSWEMDMDKVRDIVVRRSLEVIKGSTTFNLRDSVNSIK